ncbi:hypothetical protein GGI04_004870 [Coemansia thaxteri]|uniref:DUF4097 domain-containing protein n=1 Tax=Coemansia thaxteri TaxID=2663907 RepID=A0A9W8BBM9_9FUNG|nr:hypothetical protein GGI04_004870 [Coemansia thaxteri]KAJ2001596.1 hypothetical protein H4R26_004052 [Coemansia thaxteri]KAJ2465217.1 hypothetical protein GGI02_004765 [Coemansia sp. RSA 2322]KAJ2486773.1 hypothetical protein EV174_000933 [Coemansia sp. RSA 2320]
MTQRTEYFDDDKKQLLPAGYLDGGSGCSSSSSGGGGNGGSAGHHARAQATFATTAAPALPSRPNVPDEHMPAPGELPPAYSFSDPHIPVARPLQIATAASSTSLEAYRDLKIDQMKPSELVATKAFAFDRPVYIHTTGISSSTLIIEPDTDCTNTDAIVVRAEVSSQISGLDNKCNVTVAINELNEYDFYVCSTASIWSLKSINCRFIVRVPSNHAGSHPGVRIALTNGRADLNYLHGMSFGFIDLKTTCGDVSLTNVRGGRINIGTTRGAIKSNNVVATEMYDVQTTNSKVTLVDVRAMRVSAVTSNASITMTTISGDAVVAETTNCKIECTNVSAVNMKLTTTNSSIETNHVAATNLYLNTRNAKIEGTWRIRSLLDVVTTNSRIIGAILLEDPTVHANIRLSTTNSKIKATLPAESFRGVFDAKTSNSSASVQWPRGKSPSMPPFQYIINDKSYKRGTVGNVDSMRHQFSAITSNSGIDLRFV